MTLRILKGKEKKSVEQQITDFKCKNDEFGTCESLTSAEVLLFSFCFSLESSLGTKGILLNLGI